MPFSSVILSGAPEKFVPARIMGAQSKDPENAQTLHAASGHSHEAASRELPEAAMKNETSSGSFDSSSSRQAGPRPSLRMTDVDGTSPAGSKSRAGFRLFHAHRRSSNSGIQVTHSFYGASSSRANLRKEEATRGRLRSLR